MSDANIVLGYLPPEGLLGDEIELRRDLAEEACARLGGSLGLDAVETADAISQIVNHTMSDAIATITIRRGHEPQDFALCAFGGAGGMHAVAMAEALEIPWVVMPATPGVYCALGLTVADLSHTDVQTLVGLDEVTDTTVGRIMAALADKAASALRSDGVETTDIEIREQIDARYVGQVETLTVPFGDSIAKAVQGFESEYERQYGSTRSGHAVELVNARVHAIGRVHTSVQRGDTDLADALDDSAPTNRRAYFHGHGWTDAVVVQRGRLSADGVLVGPAIVEQGDATTVVPPGYLAVVDEATKAMVIGRTEWKGFQHD